MKRFPLSLLCLILAIALCSCGLPEGDISLSQKEREDAIRLARQVLENGPDEKEQSTLSAKLTEPFEREVFITTYLHEGDFIQSGFIGNTIAEGIRGAAQKLKKKKDWKRMGYAKDGYAVQVDIVSARMSSPTENKWLQTQLMPHGLVGVYRNRGMRSCYVLPSNIQLKQVKDGRALKMAKEGRCVEVNLPKKQKSGFHRFTTISFSQADPSAPVYPLYRANYIPEKITSEDIIEACILGGQCLINMQQPSGRYYYEYFPAANRYFRNTKAKKRDLYNFLRHAGTTYSLYQLYGATGREEFRQSANQATDWMVGKMRTDPSGEFTYPFYNRKAKLGGAGLALLALLERAKVTGKKDLDPLMTRLANHILRQQKNDGSFHSYYSPDPKVPAKRRRSIYYPGEALLAITRLHAYDGNQKWLDAAIRAADHLVKDRWKILGMQIAIPPDAWLMMALSNLYPFHQDPAYAEYCFMIGEDMMGDQYIEGNTKYKDYVGGFIPNPPAVTPTGSRMEGLTSAYVLRESMGLDNSKWWETIHRAIGFQIGQQIGPETAFMYPSASRSLGIFRHSVTRSHVRIDYNQHNMSSMLEAAKIFEEHGL